MSAERAAALAAISTLAIKPATGVGIEEAAATARHLEAIRDSGKALTESQRWVLACCRAKVEEGAGGDRERTQRLKDKAKGLAREYAAQHGIELDGSPLPGWADEGTMAGGSRGLQGAGA